jgi:hypothetical protein
MKHLRKFNENMQEYVDDYLSFVKDDNKFKISVGKNSVTFYSNEDFIDLSKEDDILTFIDMLALNYKLRFSFKCPDIDGHEIDRYSDYDLICKNNKIFFRALTIYIT